MRDRKKAKKLILSDANSERALLSILINHGKEQYIEISDLGINENTFTLNENRAVFCCIRYCFENNDSISIDVPSIISASKSCDFPFWFDNPENVETLEKIKSVKANVENNSIFAKKIRKLEIIRNISKSLEGAQDKIQECSGDETISEIFGIIEDKVLNMSSNVAPDSESPVKVADVIDDYIQDKIDNPIEQVGISSGFPRLDYYLGGGLRNGSIYIICARAKGGKSLFLNKVGNYTSRQLGIPVLYLYLEMSWEDQVDRMIASATGIKTKRIETGKFAQDPMALRKVKEELNNIKSNNFYCKSIAGKSIEEQINIMRRWVIREVGLNPDGTAKPCLILYDYVRLANQAGMKDMREDQAVGFLLEDISHFATKYKLPIITAAQLNRSGLTVSDESAIGISDRISWLCAGITLLQNKTDEELATKGHGIEFGNKKLIPILARYGPGIEQGNYINCTMKPDICDITEGDTVFECMSIADAEEQLKEENEQESSGDEQVPF